jgi:hypothetical protein
MVLMETGANHTLEGEAGLFRMLAGDGTTRGIPKRLWALEVWLWLLVLLARFGYDVLDGVQLCKMLKLSKKLFL